MGDATVDPWEVAQRWGGPALLVGFLGFLWRGLFSWHKRAKAAKHVRRAESKALRYLMDAQRHTLHVLLPGGSRDRLLDLSELTRQKVLIDDVREELWLADGHESQRATEQAARDIVDVLTRTQAIQAKQQAGKQQMFADDWTPEDP